MLSAAPVSARTSTCRCMCGRVLAAVVWTCDWCCRLSCHTTTSLPHCWASWQAACQPQGMPQHPLLPHCQGEVSTALVTAIVLVGSKGPVQWPLARPKAYWVGSEVGQAAPECPYPDGPPATHPRQRTNPISAYLCVPTL
jgi:hypothetical protein